MISFDHDHSNNDQDRVDRPNDPFLISKYKNFVNIVLTIDTRQHVKYEWHYNFDLQLKLRHGGIDF